jgi:Kdo2-lipid IVA lauroyltransferase/acyltransferase
MNFLADMTIKVLYVLGNLLYIIPFKFKRHVAQVVAWFWFYVLPFRKRVMLLNVSMVFAREKEEANRTYKNRCERIVFQNMLHIVLMLFELIERFAWTDKRVLQKVKFHHFELMQSLLQKKKGFFVLSSHLGNWELITRAGCAIGMPLSIITRFLRTPFFDRIWVQSRKSFGLELLNESGSGLSAIRAIQRGRVLGFIADQHTGEPHGLETQFLGLKAWCPKALAIMSDRLKAPILPAFIVRDFQSGHHHVYFEEVLSFPKLSDEGSATELLRSGSGSLNLEGMKYHIEICNSLQEKWIRRYPEQYLWMHKRFKNIIDYKSAPLAWEL